MDRSKAKGLKALKMVFTKDDVIKHVYFNNSAIGIINSGGYIVWNGKSYSSISTFVKHHKLLIAGRPISANGWDECQWKKPNDKEWKYAFTVRPD